MAQQQKFNYGTSSVPASAMLKVDEIEVVRSRMIQANGAQSGFMDFLTTAEDLNSISW